MIESHRTETTVRQRYAAGAKSPESKLCCPIDYEPEYLKVIPQEVIERKAKPFSILAAAPEKSVSSPRRLLARKVK